MSERIKERMSALDDFIIDRIFQSLANMIYLYLGLNGILEDMNYHGFIKRTLKNPGLACEYFLVDYFLKDGSFLISLYLIMNDKILNKINS